MNIQAKRVAPTRLAPLSYKGVTINSEASKLEKNIFSVFVVAKKNDGEIVWKTKLYSIKFVEALESDVQEVHLKTLNLNGDRIEAIDERQRKFIINAVDGKIIE